MDLTEDQIDQIRRLAHCIWWEPSEVAASAPARVIAQIMDMGTIEDIIAMERALGLDTLREVLRSARPGWFRPASWAFWHYRLGLTDPADEPPPCPDGLLGLDLLEPPSLTTDGVALVASVGRSAQ